MAHQTAKGVCGSHWKRYNPWSYLHLFSNRTISKLIISTKLIHHNNKFGRKMSSINHEEDLSNPKIARLRHYINPKSPSPGWEKCYQEGVTPWDMGNATPIVIDLLQNGMLPKGRAFIPGCGSGYDVVAIAGPDRYVVGLDVSSTAIKKAKEWSFSLPNAKYFDFVADDFFTWLPAEPFDMIFDYTFFCALEPSLRPSWAKKMSDILNPDGELITLMYLLDDQVSGPPYNNSIADYEEVLNPEGFKLISIVDNYKAFKFRMGTEKLAKWKPCSNNSSL